MELHIGLQSLFEHFPELTLAGEPTFNDRIGLHGLKHLPVSLRQSFPSCRRRPPRDDGTVARPKVRDDYCRDR